MNIKNAALSVPAKDRLKILLAMYEAILFLRRPMRNGEGSSHNEQNKNYNRF